MIHIQIDDLPALFKPGMNVFIPGVTGEPTAALEALSRRPDCTRGVHFISNSLPGINEFDLLALHEESSLTAFFMQPFLARYSRTGRLRYMPISYYEIDLYLRNVATIDVAIVQVSAPGGSGACSLGPCVEFNPTVLQKAKTRIAVINEHTPLLTGSVCVPVSFFSHIAYGCSALRTFSMQPPDPVSIAIADRAASLIEDGDTLQIGIGKIPSRVLTTLFARRNLRVHSGLATSEVLPLIESGALNEDRSVVCECFDAPQPFYAANPDPQWLAIKPVSFTHDPRTLASIDQLVAVNSSVEIDLLGQCNAESAGGKTISGPGGLPDFALAAHRSKRGRSIIALPSTDRSGQSSRIVARLGAQAPVTLPRGVVDFVVTEHGIADLRAKDIRERAHALIEVAHPASRESLSRQFTAEDSL